ncbi:hypothetical protein AAE02nite_22650 [Adhaeribacter aerolatus]|uniref:DUF349 domain-containing protein n=1 Tax=Adhaeribacter aerolatus TaxID=670289 RepID=A0A512AY08_9BACT|nr:DUF349 domain-containing protein [Adhaeribacter aerolatus]GEO04601.1 hypothetical protein AAE02nite_22650 [Adhaeribacter aerolatus]
MVDTTNNTTDNQAGDAAENPQRILERRLAELNARKNEGQTRSDEDLNSSGNVMGGAVAMHEVIPPTPAVPVVGTSGTEEGNNPADPLVPTPLNDSSAPVVSAPVNPTESNLTSSANAIAPTASPDNFLENNPAPEAQNIQTDELAAQESINPDLATNEVMPLAAETESVTETGSGPERIAPESLSTAGVIPATDPDLSDNLAIASPEAATSALLMGAGSTTSEGRSVPREHEMLLDEDHQDDHHSEISETDYSTLSLADLRQKLKQMLKSAGRPEARQIYELYRLYETKLSVEKTEALDRFVADGGSSDDFDYQLGFEHQELEKAYAQFRENRSREQRQDEEQKVKNAKRKQELLDELRELVESPETKSSGDKIRQIQNEWKAIGPVPAADSKQLWNSYHALLDIFYNNRSIFYELKELDRRRNLQHKVQLCERAESLVDQPSINTALQELRKLHEEWKNVGPVPNDQRDVIWERFIQASEKVHARKKEFISERKAHEQENLVKKTALLERMEAFQNFNTDRINDWRDKTDEIQKLKEEWDAVGLVPKERADEINKRFWSSYKAFFNHKNAFFKNLDEQKMQNLRLKTELCEQAEALRDSTDWDETKEKLIQLQKKWKTIGRVPDKYSDKLWQRFRSACNEFFDRKQNQVQQRENELNQASQIKQTYFEELASRITSLNTEPGSYEEYEMLRNRWLGLPSNKGTGKLDDRYFDLLEKFVNSIVDLTNEEKVAVIAELQVTRFKQGPDAQHRIQQKEQAIRRDISNLENDIRTLKTNIEFFGRSKNAEKLREEYQVRIAEADQRIQVLQRQLYAFRNS